MAVIREIHALAGEPAFLKEVIRWQNEAELLNTTALKKIAEDLMDEAKTLNQRAEDLLKKREKCLRDSKTVNKFFMMMVCAVRWIVGNVFMQDPPAGLIRERQSYVKNCLIMKADSLTKEAQAWVKKSNSILMKLEDILRQSDVKLKKLQEFDNGSREFEESANIM